MQENVQVKTPEHVTLNFRLAGLGSRGAAQITDTLITTLMNVGLLAVILLMDNYIGVYFRQAESLVVAVIIVIIFIINWGYFFLFEWLANGRTPGKMLLGLRVVRENGGRPTALSVLIRNLLRIIDMLPFYYLLGMLMVFFHPSHKRLGDIVAGTIVIHERKKKRRKSSDKKLDKFLGEKGITNRSVHIGEWERQRFTKEDWKLLRTYVHRYPGLNAVEQEELTEDVAAILLPKLQPGDRSEQLDKADRLFASYLILKEDWEFEWS